VRDGSRPGALRPYPAPAGRRPVALRPTLSSGLPLSGVLLNFQLKIINNNMNITNIKTQFLHNELLETITVAIVYVWHGGQRLYVP
jgi:hypothetical protein